MRQPILRIAPIAALAVAILLALLAVPAPKTSAGSLSTAVIGMFPKDVSEFAYADLKTARQYSWFPALREQLLPPRFRDFEKFLSSAGIDPDSQVEEMAWGGLSVTKAGFEDVVGVAIGPFDPSSTEAKFKQQKMPMIDLRGYHMYAFGSGAGQGDIFFLFLDNNTAAFGHRRALEQLIATRMGDSESLMSNTQIFPLINEVNGSGFIWGVLNKDYTHLAMQQLLPQASQFPQAATIINRLHAMTISIQADSGVDAHFQAVCDSTDDANTLAAALQAGVMYRRYQEAQTNPAFASTLDRVTITPSGDRLRVDAPVSQDQLTQLIKTRVFAVPM
ncbi:MAG: hypothetical protein WBS18_06900 [Candidatus Acidiferrales bacterium]